MKSDIWQGCYDDGWQGNIVPEAFSHPAKFSRGLIHRIYKHAYDMGWVKQGSWVLDPFAGVGLGALDAITRNLNWIGVELEEKFVKLGEQNIELWQRQLAGWSNLGTAKIVQGDSRNLRDVVNRADLVISSPPYSESVKGEHREVETAQESRNKRITKGGSLGQSQRFGGYGHTPGNLANMKEGNFDLCISSPPYADSAEAIHTGIDWEKAGRQDRLKPSNKRHAVMGDMSTPLTYGRSEGQLGSMKEGSFDLCVSSPPYEDSEVTLAQTKGCFGNLENMKLHTQNRDKIGRQYSKTNGQLGNFSGDTFWSASHEIVQQCYELLKPGSHAIWVTKDYIKNKKRVPFSDRWLALCESVGFKLVCRHQAMLVKDHGIQITTDGKDEIIQTERKSFFRRLAESKGSPRIDWEDVICFKK